MRIKSACIFSKFFGGKIKNFDMGYSENKFRQSRQFYKTFNKQENIDL